MQYCEKVKKPCVEWVEKYFKDCLCSAGDSASFGLGLVSLVCWGAAEVPQIITNFRAKSGHGVSLLFLLTWVVGDVFNLVGCLLEPSTLPTQFYTAVLYTVSTVILVAQGVYYDYVCQWWKCPTLEAKQVEDDSNSTTHKLLDPGLSMPKRPLEVPQRRESYYTSARSLAGSHDTSPFHSYLRAARSGPSALGFDSDSSSDDDVHPRSSEKFITQPRRISHSVGYGAFLATSVSIPFQGYSMMATLAERRTLQEHGDHVNAFGQWLGWSMAAIYMGGRIPQICLNIKRGSVEGLNPLMFMFALTANVTYVGSILIRSTEWEKIRANMPWLLDAVVCVALDFFIIVQYVYYRYVMQKKMCVMEEERFKIDEEASKAIVS